MIYRFGSFELDTARFELRLDGAVRPLEPQVYAVLALLIENRERLISVDELIDKVWNGRPISDAAVSSRIRSARQALGDDGTRQQYIRTLPRRGFRFVAEVRAAPGGRTHPAAGGAGGEAIHRRAALHPARSPGALRHDRRRGAPRADLRTRPAAVAVRDRAGIFVQVSRPGGGPCRGGAPARGPLLSRRLRGDRRRPAHRGRGAGGRARRRCGVG
ncbi:MAG: winged helix-turn-helix domain-containing protein [bacterium]